jgi:hypothetical protein
VVDAFQVYCSARTSYRRGVSCAIEPRSNPGIAVGQRPPTLTPPTNEPGWIFVGDRQEITFPDGSRVVLGDQSGKPDPEKIVWVRRVASVAPLSAPLPPPRMRNAAENENGPGEAGPSVEQESSVAQDPLQWHATQVQTNFCNVWSYCAYVTDYSGVYYYRNWDGTYKIDSCYAATGRTWNNPYNLPQMSYNQVKSFTFGSYAGSYQPPFGQVPAYTWVYIPGCFTYNYSTQYRGVHYGSRWDSAGSYPETSNPHSLP